MPVMVFMTLAPFEHTENSYRSIMTDVLISLAPVMVWSVFVFGARVLTISALTVISCIVFEFSIRFLLDKGNLKSALTASTDLTSVVTGLMITFMLPVSVPLYLPVFAAFIAMAVKQLSGGVGKNLINTAVLSVTIFKVFLPSFTGVFTKPFDYFSAFAMELDPNVVEKLRVLSPLQMLGRDHIYEEGVSNLFFGVSAGNMGEIAILMLFVSGAYLVYRKIIDIKGSLAFAGTVFLLAFFLPMGDSETIYFILTELMAGGVVLLAIFACNDFTTSPNQPKGKIIFGIGCGAITIFIRYMFSHFDGVYIGVLVMNLLTPLINKFTKNVPYGMLQKSKSTKIVEGKKGLLDSVKQKNTNK